MKNLIFAFAFLFAASISGYGQFNDKGYKGLKLGMSHLEVEKIVPMDQDDSVAVIYDDLKLELTFYSNGEVNELYTIRTTYKDAKLDGVSQNLMGKSLKEVKAILGDKLAPFEAAGPGSPYHLYYKDNAAKANDITSCVLEFNDSGVLSGIMASYNP
ncbi:hypothetical protein O4H26_09420 [Aequorivita viscosa]|nr:hypothetical protein [Aequorivita viscosa]